MREYLQQHIFVPFSNSDVGTGVVEKYQHINAMAIQRHCSAEELRLTHYDSEESKASESALISTHSTWKATPAANNNLASPIAPLLKDRICPIRVGQDPGSIYRVHTGVVMRVPALFALVGPYNRIDLPEDDPFDFEKLLDYLYSGDFEPRDFDILWGQPREHGAAGRNAVAATTLVHLYGLANKYSVTELETKIISKLASFVQPNKTFADVLKCVYENLSRHQPCRLKTWALAYLEQHHKMITADGALKIIIEAGGPLAWDCHKLSQMVKDP